jgi:RES domain-containing protein
LRSQRTLPRAVELYRIGDPRGVHKIFSGEGAARAEGRWHEKGQEVIYASEHFSTALLEKLAHFNGILPGGQHFIKISVPAGTTYEMATKDTLPDWHLADGTAARTFGAAWIKECRSCLLFVPSVVAREERNVLINPAHDDFKTLAPGLETPVHWDKRLFGR